MEKEFQQKSLIDSSKNQLNTSVEPELKIDDSSQINFKANVLKDNFTTSQSMPSSNSTTAVINPLKTTSCGDSSSSIINVSTHSNEPSKSFSRRNTTQPLLKKATNNAPTTSIKPLLLPAPTSDSFSQHTKSNIVSMHSTHPSSSISTPFNCQPTMTMGIATLQPQHFSYQNLPNNRYPVIPMSLQNTYPTQHQLTLTNGGTTVQLMPVMSQTNTNHITSHNNTARMQPMQSIQSMQSMQSMQPMPLFMAPMIGTHGGMLFQPTNMAIVPSQHANNNTGTTLQTFNIAATSQQQQQQQAFQHEYNACQSALLPQATLQSIRQQQQQQQHQQQIQQHNYVLPVETETPVETVSCVTTVVSDKEDVMTHQIKAVSKVTSAGDSVKTARPNMVKQRGLIRTQIYRMKEQLIEEERQEKQVEEETEQTREQSDQEEEEDVSSINLEADKKEKNDSSQSGTVPESSCQPPPLSPVVETLSVPPPSTPVHNPVTSSAASTVPSLNQRFEDLKKSCTLQPPKSTPVQTVPSLKRRLPSPEVLESPLPLKTARISPHEDTIKAAITTTHRIDRRPSRDASEILQASSKAARLTAVVRPEQRKILVHYLDDLVIFESDEPFPTSNKMQVVKAALRAGNIKLSPQKARLLTDQYSCLSDHSKTSTTFLEPLTIDIPTMGSTLTTTAVTTTTTNSSSCESLDSSQVRPLSVCSRQSTLPATLISRKASLDAISPTIKEVRDSTPTPTPAPAPTKTSPAAQKRDVPKKADLTEAPRHPKKPSADLHRHHQPPPPMKAVSPVKQQSSSNPQPPPQAPPYTDTDRPVASWTVSDVADFVRHTPGCEHYTQLFQNHEIDGEALLLLSKDNLIQGALNMKIGPALKLCARIEKRRAADPE